MSQGCVNRKHRTFVIFAVPLMLPLGCASIGSTPFGASRHRNQPLASRTSPVAQSKHVDPIPETNLAAVAAFLERTADLDMSVTRHTQPTLPLAQPVSSQSVSANSVSQDPRTPRVNTWTELHDHPGRVSANAQMSVQEKPVLRSTLATPIIRSVSIVSPAPVPEFASATPRENTTNEPLDMTLITDTDVEARLVSHLEDRLATTPSFDAEWRLRLAQIALGRADDAFGLSGFLSYETKQLMLALLRSINATRAAIRNPVLPADEALARVNELHRLVAGRADPVITAVELCRKVVTFGMYEPLESSEFVAGRTTQAIVYVEIRNFQSEQLDNGQFRSALATRLEVLTADGQSVWKHEEPEIEDQCRRWRTDFFIAQRIALPATMPAGDYVLKVLVDDRLSGRADEASHRFTLHAATSLAGSP